MGAPDTWETDHDDAVQIIVGTGNDILDELADVLSAIIQDAQERADTLREEAASVAEIDPELALELELEADEIEAVAVAECYAIAAERAEEGSHMLLKMCGNPGQETIISNAIGDFQDICFECADEATAELA